VTAFLYTGLAGRPYWNAAILAPRFIASAFCAGPAFIILVLEIVKGWTRFAMGDRIIGFLRMVVLIAGLINVFLLISEVFTEFYADSAHVASARYLFFGLHGHDALVPWIWTSISLNVLALLALISRKFEGRGVILRNIPLLMLIVAIWIEKGMGLVFPGFIPTPLGEIVEYMPSSNEVMVTVGIWGIGLFIITVLIKHAVDIETGEVGPTSK
jgi:molybdopterin-containing oxidoreductase family membrane subunit